MKSQISMFLMDTKHTLFAPGLSHVIVDLLPCQALFFCGLRTNFRGGKSAHIVNRKSRSNSWLFKASKCRVLSCDLKFDSCLPVGEWKRGARGGAAPHIKAPARFCLCLIWLNSCHYCCVLATGTFLFYSALDSVVK